MRFIFLSPQAIKRSRTLIIGVASIVAFVVLAILIYSLYSSFLGTLSWSIQDFGGNKDFPSEQIKIVYGIETPDLNKSAQVNALIKQVWIPYGFIDDEKEYCNFRVRYAEMVDEVPDRLPSQYWGYRYRYSTYSAEEPDRCFSSGDSGIWFFIDSRVTHLVGGVSPYYFPFDVMKLRGVIWLEAEDRNNSSSQIVKFAPKIVGYASTPNWIADVKTVETVTNGETGTVLEVTYRRPLIYVALTPILLLTIVFAIVALLFINETSAFLEVLVGLVFGIWGIRQVLIPSFVTWTTIVDSLLLVSYGLIGFVILVKFILGYARSNSIRLRQSRDVYRRIRKNNRNLH